MPPGVIMKNCQEKITAETLRRRVLRLFSAPPRLCGESKIQEPPLLFPAYFYLLKQFYDNAHVSHYAVCS